MRSLAAMKLPVLLSTAALLALSATIHAAPTSIFDGKTLEGWEGSEKIWKVTDGAIVGGSLSQQVAQNEFLATKKSYGDFDLKLKFKLVGTEGFVNSGVQFRSVRIPNPPNEMSGYQADLGDPSWWGSLYDESRRNKVLVASDMAKVSPVLKKGDWNEYHIRCEGPRIQLWINGVQTVDYTEPDDKTARDGKIAVQIHGGGKSEAWFKDIMIEELPGK